MKITNPAVINEVCKYVKENKALHLRAESFAKDHAIDPVDVRVNSDGDFHIINRKKYRTMFCGQIFVKGLYLSFSESSKLGKAWRRIYHSNGPKHLTELGAGKIVEATQKNEFLYLQAVMNDIPRVPDIAILSREDYQKHTA